MKSSASKTLNTIPGILAILLWSTSICLSRSLAESLGMFTAAALIFLLSGTLSVALNLDWMEPLGHLRRLSKGYLLCCGGVLVLYAVSLYTAIGLAKDRAQVIEVGLLNYLWPTFTILLSIPIFKCKAKSTLFLGILAALGGILVANDGSGKELSGEHLSRCAQESFLPYALGFAAAFLWGLYSNLARVFEGRGSADRLGVPLFLLASGAALLFLKLFFPERHVWSLQTGGELAFMVLLPSMAAYMMWDISVRRGNLTLVASFAYFAPVLSTIVTALYFGVPLELELWMGCALIALGAIVCKYSIKERSSAERVSPP